MRPAEPPVLLPASPAVPKSSTKSVLKAAKTPALAARSSLSDELWTHVFASFSLRDLLCASFVCVRWRRAILSTPRLWSVIDELSPRAQPGLPTFLKRSRDLEVDVTLDIDLATTADPGSLFQTLALHMHRVRSLSISLACYEYNHCRFVQYVLQEEAPVLRYLRIVSESFLPITPTLFKGNAPRLSEVCLSIYSLPALCPALSAVTTFASCDAGVNAIMVSDARKVFTCCPAVETLHLDAPLRDGASSALKKGSLKGSPYVIATIMDPNRPLTTLTVPEFFNSTLPFTLRTLEHESIERIIIHKVSTETCNFIFKRMAAVEHLTFVRLRGNSHIMAVDANGRQRIFPGAPSAALDSLLSSKQFDILEHLTTLAIPDTLDVKDANALFSGAAAQLTALTILVGSEYRPWSSSSVFAFVLGPCVGWQFPMLELLRLSTANPIGMIAPHNPVASLPAQDIAAFLHLVLKFTTTIKLPRLVLDGVHLDRLKKSPLIPLTVPELTSLVKVIDVVS
ncbi:hypothetical protein EXIGLDRAFT_716048 [Exidia glandulosa HHB12029]|uniref:F-box domain-containing protein n=1 Tax=Exidia glandulosa HHB12029 TaxID=1314781 RepID=A0A165QT03_EXIGL|nr:hypothetical protein EXIGLDRAFT_716048 [Exidia glandulosa HHB12029]